MPTDYSKKFQSLRKHLRLSQAGIAEKLGVPRGRISMIEIGQQNPTLELLQSVINTFGVNADYFFNKDASKINISYKGHVENIDEEYKILEGEHVAEEQNEYGKEKPYDVRIIENAVASVVVNGEIKALKGKIRDLEELLRAKNEIIELYKSQTNPK